MAVHLVVKYAVHHSTMAIGFLSSVDLNTLSKEFAKSRNIISVLYSSPLEKSFKARRRWVSHDHFCRSHVVHQIAFCG